MAASRAFAVAGVSATSNLLAAARHGIPAAGTVAHAFIQAFDREADAFRAFARLYPETVLLVDTYDTPRGVARVVELARELGPEFRISGIRLDSGDLLALSVEARRMLDAAGLSRVRIFASGGLEENEVARLVAAGAPIDAFGVGTEMSVSGDVPALDLAYKLVAYDGVGRTKLSLGKRILPGAKQVFRRPEGDVLALAEEDLPGEPLLRPMMAGGRRLAPRSPGRRARAPCAGNRHPARTAAWPRAGGSALACGPEPGAGSSVGGSAGSARGWHRRKGRAAWPLPMVAGGRQTLEASLAPAQRRAIPSRNDGPPARCRPDQPAVSLAARALSPRRPVLPARKPETLLLDGRRPIRR